MLNIFKIGLGSVLFFIFVILFKIIIANSNIICYNGVMITIYCYFLERILAKSYFLLTF